MIIFNYVDQAVGVGDGDAHVSRGQDHFKQSSSRLHFIADRVVPWGKSWWLAVISSPKMFQRK